MSLSALHKLDKDQPSGCSAGISGVECSAVLPVYMGPNIFFILIKKNGSFTINLRTSGPHELSMQFHFRIRFFFLLC